MALSNIFMES